MRSSNLSILALVCLAACNVDNGFPWPDELSTAWTESASQASDYPVGQLSAALIPPDVMTAYPEGCGTLSGKLTGGVPDDTDGDGVPDNVTLTLSHAECLTEGYFYTGTLQLSDPGTAPGFNYVEDIRTDIPDAEHALRQTNRREIRLHGTSTTGTVSHHDWIIRTDLSGEPSEENYFDATFTLTAAEGTSLGLGEIGPGSLTFTGQMYWKDAIPPLGQPYRFTLSTSTPLTIDPSCIEADHVTGGSVEGLLNGSGPVTFTRTWTACGAATSIVDGTTD